VKLHYDPETDSLYIELKPGASAETRAVADGLNIDLDATGEVVGFDIDHAGARFDLSKLGTTGLPVQDENAARAAQRRLLALKGKVKFDMSI
jgi:uncharacterized protein YuzE